MRHRMRGRHLSRTAAHRKALRQNITNSLFTYGRIVTTLEKAKETKSFAEKLITIAKKGLLKKESDKPGYVHCYRQILARLRNADVARKLLGEGLWRETGGIAQRFVNRHFSTVPKSDDNNVHNRAYHFLFLITLFSQW